MTGAFFGAFKGWSDSPAGRRAVLHLPIVSLVIVMGAETRSAPGRETIIPEQFSLRVITAEPLADPWEVLYGPDDHLWVTERSANALLRIDPDTGETARLATIGDAYRSGSQDGVLGMALHPEFLKGRGLDFLYVAFVYDAGSGPEPAPRMKLRRYTYHPRSGVLDDPIDLLTDIPTFEDHVGGRLTVGPDRKLYLTVGDGAANFMANACRPNRAQDLPSADDVQTRTWTTYQGKTLRINLDGSVPSDNPVINGVRSHVYSYGHRNSQGLAFGPHGRLYASEHGPSTDDELNVIVSGGNYGWPYVAGYQDDRAYIYANWSASAPTPCASGDYDQFVAPPTVPQQLESAWTIPGFVPPLRTFFSVDNDYPFQTLGNATIAPSGTEVYSKAAIPGWRDSILMASLTRGAVFRVKLNAEGTAIVGDTMEYFKTHNRYRDIAISPDGRTIYVTTDNWNGQDNPGAVLAFTYKAGKE